MGRNDDTPIQFRVSSDREYPKPTALALSVSLFVALYVFVGAMRTWLIASKEQWLGDGIGNLLPVTPNFVLIMFVLWWGCMTIITEDSRNNDFWEYTLVGRLLKALAFAMLVDLPYIIIQMQTMRENRESFFEIEEYGAWLGALATATVVAVLFANVTSMVFSKFFSGRQREPFIVLLIIVLEVLDTTSTTYTYANYKTVDDNEIVAFVLVALSAINFLSLSMLSLRGFRWAATPPPAAATLEEQLELAARESAATFGEDLFFNAAVWLALSIIVDVPMIVIRFLLITDPESGSSGVFAWFLLAFNFLTLSCAVSLFLHALAQRSAPINIDRRKPVPLQPRAGDVFRSSDVSASRQNQNSSGALGAMTGGSAADRHRRQRELQDEAGGSHSKRRDHDSASRRHRDGGSHRGGGASQKQRPAVAEMYSGSSSDSAPPRPPSAAGLHHPGGSGSHQSNQGRVKTPRFLQNIKERGAAAAPHRYAGSAGGSDVPRPPLPEMQLQRSSTQDLDRQIVRSPFQHALGGGGSPGNADAYSDVGGHPSPRRKRLPLPDRHREHELPSATPGLQLQHRMVKRLSQTSQMQPTLCVDVFCAQGLAAKDLTGTSDPYCKVMLVDEHDVTQEEYRTEVVWQTLEPEWNQSFRVWNSLFSSNGNWRLRITCWDKDVHKNDDILGMCEWELGELETEILQQLHQDPMAEGTVEDWFQLVPRGDLDEGIQGSIKVRIQYQSPKMTWMRRREEHAASTAQSVLHGSPRNRRLGALPVPYDDNAGYASDGAGVRHRRESLRHETSFRLRKSQPRQHGTVQGFRGLQTLNAQGLPAYGGHSAPRGGGQYLNGGGGAGNQFHPSQAYEQGPSVNFGAQATSAPAFSGMDHLTVGSYEDARGRERGPSPRSKSRERSRERSRDRNGHGGRRSRHRSRSRSKSRSRPRDRREETYYEEEPAAHGAYVQSRSRSRGPPHRSYDADDVQQQQRHRSSREELLRQQEIQRQESWETRSFADPDVHRYYDHHQYAGHAQQHPQQQPPPPGHHGDGFEHHHQRHHQEYDDRY